MTGTLSGLALSAAAASAAGAVGAAVADNSTVGAVIGAPIGLLLVLTGAVLTNLLPWAGQQHWIVEVTPSPDALAISLLSIRAHGISRARCIVRDPQGRIAVHEAVGSTATSGGPTPLLGAMFPAGFDGDTRLVAGKYRIEWRAREYRGGEADDSGGREYFLVRTRFTRA